VREGPGTEYAQSARFSRNEELDIIGRFGDCTWLKVGSRNQAVSGWISGDSRHVERRVACEDIPPGAFRPLTGLIKTSQRGGYGALTVSNGTSRDGVVILMLDDEPVMAAYVRSQDSLAMRSIPDGIYHLYFTTGSEWNGEEFTSGASYQRFEDAFPFATTSTTYTTWSVTLHGVAGGTASAEAVDESAFPDIGN
jgi:hypothetical protein